MFKTTAIIGVMIGLAMFAVVASGSAEAVELAGGQIATANDTLGFAQMQLKYEEMRNTGEFTNKTLGELAYYYSEKVPVSSSARAVYSPNKRETQVLLTDCKGTPGFPASPKFLYGGLDPVALVAGAKNNRIKKELDDPYSNFFSASGRDLGTCANFSTLDIQTGNGRTTQYVVLFKTLENKNNFDQARLDGNAPMPAAGFWCLWGLGGGSPHFAVPNNPQYVVYELDSATRGALESATYIGANYWPRTHGFGSPFVLGRIAGVMEEFKNDIRSGDTIKQPNRFKSLIFLDPLAP